jgi:hypothetical protein
MVIYPSISIVQHLYVMPLSDICREGEEAEWR